MDRATKDISPALNVPAATRPLRVVHYLISEADGKWKAHCLDLDLQSFGKDWNEASRKLDDLVKAHIEVSLATGQVTDNLASEAPLTYWKDYYKAKPIEMEPRTIHVRIPQAFQLTALDSEDSQVGIDARRQTRGAHAA